MLSLNKKRTRSRDLDVSILPANIFSLKGDAFYSLVKELTSEDIEELLKVQRISTVRCFLSTNPLTLFNLQSDDPSITRLQHRLSFKVANNTNVALAGIDGDYRYLKQLFETFSMKMKKRKIDVISSIANTHPSQQSPATTMVASSTPSHPPDVKRLSVAEHRTYLNQQIEFWWDKYRREQRLSSYQIVESDDYELILTNDTAIVKCSCKTRINLPLPKERDHYQLSNFYKHLTQNVQCSVIKRKSTASESEHDDDSSSSSSSSDSSTESCAPRASRSMVTKKSDQHQQRLSKNFSYSAAKSKST